MGEVLLEQETSYPGSVFKVYMVHSIAGLSCELLSTGGGLPCLLS
jgi:hypothetical protein